MADKKVSGRRLVLQMIDSMMEDERNIRTLREAFQDRLNAEPISFFKEIIMPVMPKDGMGLDGPNAEEGAQSVVISLMPKNPPAV